MWWCNTTWAKNIRQADIVHEDSFCSATRLTDHTGLIFNIHEEEEVDVFFQQDYRLSMQKRSWRCFVRHIVKEMVPSSKDRYLPGGEAASFWKGWRKKHLWCHSGAEAGWVRGHLHSGRPAAWFAGTFFICGRLFMSGYFLHTFKGHLFSTWHIKSSTICVVKLTMVSLNRNSVFIVYVCFCSFLFHFLNSF